MTPFNRLPKNHVLGGRYLIDSPLGSGRSATIYKARDQSTDSWVALKVLDPFLIQDPVSVERFRREAQAVRMLEHPNIIKVYSMFTDGDLHCIVMEFFEGQNLKSFIEKNGGTPIDEFISIANTIASALECCHRTNVLHRDLKPQNILINARLEVKVVDFGISKINSMSDLTKTGTFLGTPEYMAPELFTRASADPSCDIYSLGALLYELLAGTPPYPSGSIQKIMMKQRSEEVPPLSDFRQDIPEWLEATIRKCLRVNHCHRYQSVYELRADLSRSEQALSLIEKHRDRVYCFSCKTEMLTGLPFCYQCGRFSADLYEKGEYGIAAYRCDDVALLASHLEKFFSESLIGGWRKRLGRPPIILLEGISNTTAVALYNELGDFPCELQVLKNPWTEFRLPLRYLVYEALFALPGVAVWYLMPWKDVVPVELTNLAYLTLSQLFIIGLFLKETRPLIRLKKLRERADERSGEISEMAEKLRSIASARVRFHVACIVRSYLELQRRASVIGAIAEQSLKDSLSGVWKVAGRIVECEAFLSNRGMSEMKERKRQLELKIRHQTDPAKVETIIAQKVAVESEIRDFAEIQETHSRLSIALINFQSVITQIEREAERETPAERLEALNAIINECGPDRQKKLAA